MNIIAGVARVLTPLWMLATALAVLTVLLGCSTSNDVSQPTSELRPPETATVATPRDATLPADHDDRPMAVLLISGRINLDTGDVVVDPTRALPQIKPVSMGNGDYSVELLDADGTVMTSQNFDVDEIADLDGNIVDFSTSLVRPSEPISVLRIAQDGVEIARTTGDGSVPSIAMVSPVPGSTVSRSNALFEWRGESPSTGALYYTVLVSFDGGDSYTNLLSGSEKTRLEVPETVLEQTSEALLLASVSDGLNTSFVVGEPFSITD